MINKLTRQQIIDLTYDGKILESDDRISGYVDIDGKKELRVWVLFDDEYYTNDWDYVDEWTASRNNMTVNELRLMRMKEKIKVDGYLPKK